MIKTFAKIVCLFLLTTLAGAELVPQKFADGGGGALLCRGNYLYAVLKYKLCIYDVSSPTKPKLLSSVPALGNRQFALEGNTLYLSCRHNGVQIFDVSDPRKPREISNFKPVELATGLTVSGDVLGVTQRIYGVEFFDVSDPRKPRSMGRLKTDEAQSAVFFGKGKIAIGDWGSGKAVIGDVSDPSAPKTLSASSLSGMGDGVAVRDNYLFAVTGNKIFRGKTNGHGLEIFDISDLKKPVKVSQVVFPLDKKAIPDWWQVIVTKKTAFVADACNGVYIIDISNIKAPKIKDHLLLGDDAASQIAPGKGVLYISGHRKGLYLLPCKDATPVLPPVAEVKVVPKKPAPQVAGLRSIDVPGFVWRLTVDGDKLYASCGEEGLREYQICADGSLKPGRVYKQSCFDCQVHDNLLFMARDKTLDIYDRKSNKLLSSTPGLSWLPVFQIHLYDHGKVVVANGRGSMLLCYDVSDPRKPKLISRPSGHGILYDDMLPDEDIDGIFMVNWHSRSPALYRANKTPDAAICTLEKLSRVSNQANGITVCQGKFLLFANKGQVVVLDPKKPDQHTIINGKHQNGIPTADGNLIALSRRPNGEVTLFSFKNGTLTPISGRTYKLPFTVTGRAVFYKGKAYIPAGTYGIYWESK